MQLMIDGSSSLDEDAPYQGDGQFPPFAVFDVDDQDNVVCQLPTRNSAEKLASMLVGVFGCEVLQD